MICGVAVTSDTAYTACTNSDSCWLRNSGAVLRDYSATTTAAAKARTTTTTCTYN
jgi:hypothetical protein